MNGWIIAAVVAALLVVWIFRRAAKGKRMFERAAEGAYAKARERGYEIKWHITNIHCGIIGVSPEPFALLVYWSDDDYLLLTQNDIQSLETWSHDPAPNRRKEYSPTKQHYLDIETTDFEKPLLRLRLMSQREQEQLFQRIRSVLPGQRV